MASICWTRAVLLQPALLVTTHAVISPSMHRQVSKAPLRSTTEHYVPELEKVVTSVAWDPNRSALLGDGDINASLNLLKQMSDVPTHRDEALSVLKGDRAPGPANWVVTSVAWDPNRSALMGDGDINASLSLLKLTSYVPMIVLEGARNAETRQAAVFLGAVIASGLWCGFVFVTFALLRARFPQVYSDNVQMCKAPFAPASSTFGWFRATWSFTVDEVVEHAGFDQAMLLEFMHFTSRLMARVGLPMVFILVPCHWVYGAKLSGQSVQLNTFLFASVFGGKPALFWLHAIVVWFVVILVQKSVFLAHTRFLLRRKDWLMEMPKPRATTVLVQSIPQDFATDEKLREYFGRLFGSDAVKEATVVKRTGDIQAAMQRCQAAQKALEACQLQQDLAMMEPGGTSNKTEAEDDEDTLPAWSALAQCESEFAQAEETLGTARSAFQRALKVDPASVHTTTAFVTFKDRRTAHACMNMSLRDDPVVFMCASAPDPSDVSYIHLERTPWQQRLGVIISVVLILFIFVFTACAMISGSHWLGKGSQSSHDNSGQLFVDAVAVGLALQLALASILSIFAAIVHRFASCVSEADTHRRLQNIFFGYQVYVFMLLPLCMSKAGWMIANGSLTFDILAKLVVDTLPLVSRVGVNFILLSWVFQAHSLLRCRHLVAFLKIRHEELAELGSLDSNGIGTRSASLSFVVVLGLVFASLVPAITALVLASILIGRVSYGYLIAFAESKKPDLGGGFWTSQMHSIQCCMPIYILLMFGVLIYGGGRQIDYQPYVALASLGFWIWSYWSFRHTFAEQSLTLEEIIDCQDPSRFVHRVSPRSPRTSYVQPELSNDSTRSGQQKGGRLVTLCRPPTPR